jgi:predicted transcriptional regulator
MVAEPGRTMTIRLDGDLAEDLATVAAVDGRPLVEVIRSAIAEHVAARKADPRFRAALRDHLSRMRRMLGEDAA